MMEDPILITGCARSRTSMIAGIIDLCGAWGGQMAGPNSNNKKGMFENIEIRNNLTKPYLISLGADPMGQFPLPNTMVVEEDWRDRVLRVLIFQGLRDGMIWFYKGAKMCLVWEQWAFAFPNAKWIIVRRDKQNIIQSCMRTPFMKAFSTEERWSWWVERHLEKFKEMLDNNLDIYEIDSDNVMEGNLQELRLMVKWLGLEWNEQKILEFIDPSISHFRRESNG